MVPLGSGVALAAQASQMAGVGGVAVHMTPHAAKAKHVWTFIGGAWNRPQCGDQQLPHLAHRDDPRRATAAIPPTEAATQPMDLQPLSVEAATRLLSTPDRRRPGQADVAAPVSPPNRPRTLGDARCNACDGTDAHGHADAHAGAQHCRCWQSSTPTAAR